MSEDVAVKPTVWQPLTPRGVSRFATATLGRLFLVAFVIGGGFSDSGPAAGVIVGGVLFATVGFAVWCWLTITYMHRNGQSIAKKLLGIKVVRSDGSPASLGRLIWLRNVLNWFISIVPLYGVVDSLFIFGEAHQCLHDKIADTIVVKA